MTEILYGKPVAAAIQEDVKERAARLTEAGHVPGLAILRVGNRSDDLAYENRLKNLCRNLGIKYEVIKMNRQVSQEDFEYVLDRLSRSEDTDGILVFRPLPPQIDEDRVARRIPLDKDIDRMNPENLTILFTELAEEYCPCTPEAVIEILKYHNVPMEGANVAIVNRSLVLGRPLAMMFLKNNATVTMCHSRTRDLASVTSKADILVAGIGRAGFFGAEYIGKQTTVIDVGINFVDGKMTGDVVFEEADGKAKAITPVPGGVGAVTSSLLLRHVVESAEHRAALEVRETDTEEE